MKPPWKYLTQLVSRRRADDEQDQTGDRKAALPEIHSALAASVALPEVAPTLPDVEGGTVPHPVQPNAATESDEVAHLSSPATVDPFAPAVDQPEPDSATAPANEGKSSATRPVKARAARKARLDTTSKDPVLAAVEEQVSEAPSPSATPFFDEASSLDADIRQLKDQLAGKLRLQNAQLRKMLERFERS
jgi:hypothetical protein